MAEGVVDVLEAIQIQQEHGEWLPALQGTGRHLPEAPAVRQVCQLVLVGKAAELLLCSNLLGHVPGECGFRRKPATHSDAKPANVPI